MIETKEVNVDGRTYTITQLGSSKGLKMLTRLTKMIGEPLGILATSGGMDAELDGKLIGAAVKALASQMDEDLVVDTVKQLLETTLCEGKKIQFETHFAGQFGHLFKVLKEVLEVQYGDFLGAISGLSSGFPKVKA